MTVNPKVDVRRYRAEMGDNLLALPCVGQRDGASIASHMVVFHRHLGWVVLEMSTPSEAHV